MSNTKQEYWTTNLIHTNGPTYHQRETKYHWWYTYYTTVVWQPLLRLTSCVVQPTLLFYGCCHLVLTRVNSSPNRHATLSSKQRLAPPTHFTNTELKPKEEQTGNGWKGGSGESCERILHSKRQLCSRGKGGSNWGPLFYRTLTFLFTNYDTLDI